MGVSPHPLLVSLDLKGVVQENEGMTKSTESLMRRSKVLEAQAKRRSRQVRNQRVIRSKRPRRILMKRRARPEGSRRPANPIERKVRTLKKLIPNKEPKGLDGLFRETADYILSLQVRIKVMQIMVKVLTGSNE